MVEFNVQGSETRRVKTGNRTLRRYSFSAFLISMIDQPLRAAWSEPGNDPARVTHVGPCYEKVKSLKLVDDLNRDEKKALSASEA
jgi:hypothetical protein